MNFVREILAHHDLTKDISTKSMGTKCPPLTCVGEPVLSGFIHHHYFKSFLKSDVQISPMMFSVI